MKSNKTLYICGGGVTSVYTAGMLEELEIRGMTEDFECVVGASSGAFSACFFVSKSAQAGAAGYWRMLPYFYKDKKFISLWNIFRLKPIMDVRYLISYGLTASNQNPVPWQKVIDSTHNKRGLLVIQVMDADTGQPIFCSHFKTIEALQDAVAASCAIPFTAGLHPYTLLSNTVANSTITDHQGRPITKPVVRCYDGDTCDMYARAHRKILMSEEILIVTAAHSNHANKCFPFGKWLAPIEFVLGWIIFFPRFKAIWGYQRERLFGAARREFFALQKQASIHPKTMTVVTLPKHVRFRTTDVLCPNKMKTALIEGQTAISNILT